MPRADKGKKRKAYDMSLRNFQKQLRDLKRTVETQEKFEKKRTRARTTSAERKRKKRAELIPVDRICKVCNKLKFKRRQWVVKNHIVMCKSCYMKGAHNE